MKIAYLEYLSKLTSNQFRLYATLYSLLKLFKDASISRRDVSSWCFAVSRKYKGKGKLYIAPYYLIILKTG